MLILHIIRLRGIPLSTHSKVWAKSQLSLFIGKNLTISVDLKNYCRREGYEQ